LRTLGAPLQSRVNGSPAPNAAEFTCSATEAMMDEVESLLDVLNPGETALAVFTDGHNLQFNADGTGTSGNWVADPARVVARFVIYLRHGPAGDLAQVHRADFVGTAISPEPGRIVVNFENAQQVAVTRASWPEFADTGANPVRYV